MELAESVAEVQRVADYRRARGALWGGGIVAIGLGIIAVLLDLPLVGRHPFALLLVLTDLFLVAEGAWNLAAPTPRGLLVDGAVLLVVGAWNVIVALLAVVAQAPLVALGGMVGLWYVVCGLDRFETYRRFAGSLFDPPPAEDVKRLDQLVRAVLRLGRRNSPDLLRFRVGTAFAQNEWRAQLARGAALFIDQGGGTLLAACTGEVAIRVEGKALLGRVLRASFRVKDQNWKGYILPEELAKYEGWKLSAH
jgi:hypothetical protein